MSATAESDSGIVAEAELSQSGFRRVNDTYDPPHTKEADEHGQHDQDTEKQRPHHVSTPSQSATQAPAKRVRRKKRSINPPLAVSATACCVFSSDTSAARCCASCVMA